MAINPINVPRVSLNLRTQTLLAQLQSNQVRIFREQQRISTGRNLLAASDDPLAAGRIVRLTDRYSRQDQILDNLKHVDRWLGAAESAVGGISDLLIQAKTIASDNINSTQSDAQRSSAAIVIDSIVDQLLTIGNQRFDGKYLFGGQRTNAAPFETALGRATFVGDSHGRNAFVDDGLERSFSLSADQLFGLGDKTLAGYADLNPALSGATRISDIAGTNNAGVRAGVIHATQIGGVGAGGFDLDIAGIDTIGELVTRFNAAAASAGVGLTASLTANGLQIAGAVGSQVKVDDVSGNAAADLGIRATSGVGTPLVGGDVNVRLTTTTTLASLNGGAGLSLASGIVINNGGQSTTVTFSGANTVQDVLNRINHAGAGVRATLNASGTGIDILNQVGGSNLSIGENGGSDATALGIRSFHGATRLSELNGGRGIHTVTGADLHIVDANNIAFDVDLDGASTLADVITKINTAAGAAGSALVAGFKTIGNGLSLTQPAGAQAIVVTRGGLSAAADDLGLLKTGGTSSLDGDDVNPLRQGGVFTVLYQLADALRSNNTQAITEAGEKLEAATRSITEQQGSLGARSQANSERLSRTEDAVLATRRFLSEVQDVDLTEAITKFQQAQLALEANLKSGSSLLSLSLLDFLK